METGGGVITDRSDPKKNPGPFTHVLCCHYFLLAELSTSFVTQLGEAGTNFLCTLSHLPLLIWLCIVSL